jgi:hypothetical protein
MAPLLCLLRQWGHPGNAGQTLDVARGTPGGNTMPPTTKDSVDIAAPSSPSPNSGSGPGTNPRPNPVCLDVPVVIRNLPAGNGTSDLLPAGALEEHARTVIVFDNGAVLRVSEELPVGQEVVVSNSQGREAVCRLARTPNLPNIKGFVEIEFLEPVSDFWGIQQPAPQTNVLTPPPELASELRPADAVSSPEAAESSVQESGAPSGEAPSFDDIAGVVPMSPGAEPTDRQVSQQDSPKTSGAVKERPRPEKQPEEKRMDTAKTVAPAAAKRPATQALAASKKDGTHRPSVSANQNNFLGKSIFGASSVSTPKKSRGNAVALLVVGLLILAGIAAYLFLYRGGIASFSGKATEAAPSHAMIFRSTSVHESSLRLEISVPAVVGGIPGRIPHRHS